MRPRAPGVLLRRLSRPLNLLLATGAAAEVADDLIELYFNDEEVRQGGMVSVSMYVAVRCPSCASGGAVPCAPCGGRGAIDELFTAWVAVPPGVAEGTILVPSAQLEGVLRPMRLQVRYGRQT